MKKQPKQFDDDDGRVVCNMDVSGMRWHDKGIRRDISAAPKAAHVEQMTRSGTRLYTWYSLLAAMLIVLVFSVTWVLFTLFCTQIWFR
jgi:hypothetical protein